MSARFGITGATGQLGGRVARLLADAGLAQRLLCRDTSRAPALPGASAVTARFGDLDGVRRAVSGLDTVLMVSASETADRLDQHRTFVDAVVQAGVHTLVYVSFADAAPDATFTLARDHFHTEEHIRASGLRHVFVRDCLYLDVLPSFAGTGVIRGPAGEGRVAGVSRDDAARSLASVLRDVDAHVGRTWTLTGPEALTLSEAAQTMTRILGRAIAFEDETVEQAYASRSTYGVPQWQLDAWVSTYTAIAAGEMAEVTDHVERLTGRAPMSLADLLSSS